MNDELHNEQDNLAEENNKTQTNVCAVCKQDPCICTNKEDGANPKTSSGNNTKTKLPKISWI